MILMRAEGSVAAREAAAVEREVAAAEREAAAAAREAAASHHIKAAAAREFTSAEHVAFTHELAAMVRKNEQSQLVLVDTLSARQTLLERSRSSGLAALNSARRIRMSPILSDVQRVRVHMRAALIPLRSGASMLTLTLRTMTRQAGAAAQLDSGERVQLSWPRARLRQNRSTE